MAGYNTGYQISGCIGEQPVKQVLTIVSHKQELAAVYMNELDSTLMRASLHSQKSKSYMVPTFHVVF